MKQVRRLAVIGLGRLGRACAEAIRVDEAFTLAGIVRRTEQCRAPLPSELRQIPVAAHISELENVDAALLCVPTQQTLEVAGDLLQHRLPIVECATLHSEEFQAHKRELDRLARNHETSAIVGAGWDPGALSLLRALFALLTPRGHTETTPRAAIRLHHTPLADTISGVKAARCTELRSAEGKPQRYIYVELEPGADPEQVEKAIQGDPLYLGEQSLVFPVESIAALEDEGHGVLLERRGSAGKAGHQHLLFEGRFSESALAAQVMLRTLPTHRNRAYSLFDLPQGALWGDLKSFKRETHTGGGAYRKRLSTRNTRNC